MLEIRRSRTDIDPHRVDNSEITAHYLLTISPCSTQSNLFLGAKNKVEVTKALAALQPLYGKNNIEVVTVDGQRVRGIVRSMKTTQALTTPSVKIECADGELVKIPFPAIAEIKDLNPEDSPQ
jgi:hypothetical protein